MITLNSNSELPLYMQIYEQIRNEIITGELPVGSKLPSTRHLSDLLSVGRNTVENAYLQLSSEGYVESRTGSGFVVQDIHNMISFGTGIITSKVPMKTKEDKPISVEVYPYHFEYGHLSSGDFPMAIWRKISNKALAEITAEDMTKYQDRKGEVRLRYELKDYLRRSRGVNCSEEQIVLCSGFEYALSILSQLLRSSFDRIALEEPGYLGARTIFQNNGMEVIPIDIQKDGLDIKKLDSSKVRAVYVTPSHQFPTGAVMPVQKRLQLLEWVKGNYGIVIEDDYDSELRYNSRPIPSISSIAESDNVIYIGTFSKALSPSIRVCYMVLPDIWMKRYEETFKMYQTTVSLLQQRILMEYIRSGHWERHLRKICKANKKKHDLLLRTIQEELGNDVIIHGKNAGLHILLESVRGLTEAKMLDKAKKFGVLVSPVSPFWSDVKKYTDNMVLLGFGNISEADITAGIRALAAAWRE